MGIECTVVERVKCNTFRWFWTCRENVGCGVSKNDVWKSSCGTRCERQTTVEKYVRERNVRGGD